MDFLQRNANHQAGGHKEGTPAFSGMGGGHFKNVMGDEPRWVRVAFVVLLFSLTVLAIAIALLLYFGKVREGNYVKDNGMQAVFLTNGQVYFGKVKDVTSQYVNLQDIYYLNTEQQQAKEGDKNQQTSTNFALIKLGCELHGPTDQMIINRDQVTFWENLKNDGKVAKAIEQWRTQNPNGQECKETTSSTQQSTGTANTQNTTEQNQ